MVVAAPMGAGVFLQMRDFILKISTVLDYSLFASKVAVIVDTVVTSLVEYSFINGLLIDS